MSHAMFFLDFANTVFKDIGLVVNTSGVIVGINLKYNY